MKCAWDKSGKIEVWESKLIMKSRRSNRNAENNFDQRIFAWFDGAIWEMAVGKLDSRGRLERVISRHLSHVDRKKLPPEFGDEWEGILGRVTLHKADVDQRGCVFQSRVQNSTKRMLPTTAAKILSQIWDMHVRLKAYR